MSRRARVIGVAVALLALAGAGTAAAAGRGARAQTKVRIEALTNTADDAVLIGSISSPKPKCLDDRKVRVTLIPMNGPSFPFDVARTGGGGGWLALHDLSEVEAIVPLEAIKVKVAKRRVRLSGGRTLTCGTGRLRQKFA